MVSDSYCFLHLSSSRIRIPIFVHTPASFLLRSLALKISHKPSIRDSFQRRRMILFQDIFQTLTYCTLIFFSIQYYWFFKAQNTPPWKHSKSTCTSSICTGFMMKPRAGRTSTGTAHSHKKPEKLKCGDISEFWFHCTNLLNVGKGKQSGLFVRRAGVHRSQKNPKIQISCSPAKLPFSLHSALCTLHWQLVTGRAKACWDPQLFSIQHRASIAPHLNIEYTTS